MKVTAPRTVFQLSAIVCDRCGAVTNAEHISASTGASINFVVADDVLFRRGTKVEADFCQKCLGTLLGKWIRIARED